MKVLDPESVLFIRRDNIGDLVCTTPAIRAVRRKFTAARIGVLVNSYNAEVLAGNPDIDEVYVYEKEKHRGEKTRLRVYAENIRLMGRIRKARFDVAVACTYGFSRRLSRFASLTGAVNTIGYGRPSAKAPYTITIDEPKGDVHEVEAMMALVRPLGVEGPPPAPLVVPDKGEVEKVKGAIGEGEGVVAFHISSRRPENRWPARAFAELGDLLQERFPLRVLLLWSPGGRANPLHPGDDDLAREVAGLMKKRPLMYRTETLRALIAALSVSGITVCLDGGAMHLAAALKRPVLTIWGRTEPARWAPRGAPHIILRKKTGKAVDVTVDEAFGAMARLLSGKI